MNSSQVDINLSSLKENSKRLIMYVSFLLHCMLVHMLIQQITNAIKLCQCISYLSTEGQCYYIAQKKSLDIPGSANLYATIYRKEGKSFNIQSKNDSYVWHTIQTYNKSVEQMTCYCLFNITEISVMNDIFICQNKCK